MIAEIGHAMLWIAAGLALLQIIAGIASLTGREVAPVRPLAAVQGLLTIIAFLLLIWLFVRSDMSIDLVARFGGVGCTVGPLC